MGNIAAPVEGLFHWRRRALTAALLGLLVGFAALAAPSRSEAACAPSGGEYDFLCTTNSSGTATLVVPSGNFIAQFEPAFEPIKDCTWSVAVDFGDGTNGSYVWNAEEGLVASHTFPAPGDYVVIVEATEGTHNPNGEPCPDLTLSALVTYPEPPPPPEEPPGEEPPPEEPPSGEQPRTLQQPGASEQGGGDHMSQGASNISRRYWRRCGRGILTHRVRCRRARRVLREARPSLAKGLRAPVHVAGFRCHLRPHAKRKIACRRGGRRILAP